MTLLRGDSRIGAAERLSPLLIWLLPPCHTRLIYIAPLAVPLLGEANLSSADLSSADLSGANLVEVNLSGANLNNANLSGTDLSGANLRDADFSNANLRDANLRDADFSNANLSGANLRDANLRDANLSNANLSNANLSNANLSNANLSGANLSNANLSNANLSNANLSNANLSKTQALNASFSSATFSGTCIADWHIGSSTKLDNIVCDHIFRTEDADGQRSGRLPVDASSFFAEGEFTQRFQILASALETIDLTFTEGIDWQAFFQSFQEVCSNRPTENLAIQGLEKKGQAFVVRLETNADTDKSAIETEVKQLYVVRLAALETQYAERLKLQGIQVEDARRAIEVARKRETSLLEIMATMAENKTSKINDFRGAQFGGGYAETVGGDQVGGTINNYGANLDDITRLIGSLRDQAQAFPAKQKDDVLLELEDLESDLQKPEPNPKRIGQRLKRLAATVAAVGTVASGAATFTGDLTKFADNVSDLADVIGIPIEQVDSE